MKYTGIIILQYNNWTDTVNCIKSIQQYNTAPIKLIIVDNGSPEQKAVSELTKFLHIEYHRDLKVVNDNTISALPERLCEVTFLCSYVNDGYARGNNKGLELAFNDPDIEYTLILNNDTLFVEDILPRLKADVDSKPDCAFITPILYKKDMVTIDRNCARRQPAIWYLALTNLLIFRSPGFLKKMYYIDLKSGEGLLTAQLISGSCMFSRKSVMKKLGGYDPNTFLYYEENILWEKVKDYGLCNYVDTDCRCIHLGGATIKKRSSLKIIDTMFKSQYYFTHNFLDDNVFKSLLLRFTQRWVITIISIKRKLFN